MKKSKTTRLEAKGWKIGSAEEFLELSPEESAYLQMKLALSDKLKQRRLRKRMTQAQLAKLVHSSQSRVAKMEAGDPSVSLDLLVRSLFSLGASRRELAQFIAAPKGGKGQKTKGLLRALAGEKARERAS